ncbi:MAG: spike base protein, RCAP_Rcc01079 family [Saprospiraceae bacterium]
MPALDNYDRSAVALDAPADDMVPLTPSDSTDLVTMSKALYVTVAGNIEVITRAGNTRVIAVPANFILPLRITRLKASSTTATGVWAFV